MRYNLHCYNIICRCFSRICKCSDKYMSLNSDVTFCLKLFICLFVCPCHSFLQSKCPVDSVALQGRTPLHDAGV